MPTGPSPRLRPDGAILERSRRSFGATTLPGTCGRTSTSPAIDQVEALCSVARNGASASTTWVHGPRRRSRGIVPFGAPLEDARFGRAHAGSGAISLTRRGTTASAAVRGGGRPSRRKTEGRTSPVDPPRAGLREAGGALPTTQELRRSDARRRPKTHRGYLCTLRAARRQRSMGLFTSCSEKAAPSGARGSIRRKAASTGSERRRRIADVVLRGEETGAASRAFAQHR